MCVKKLIQTDAKLAQFLTNKSQKLALLGLNPNHTSKALQIAKAVVKEKKGVDLLQRVGKAKSLAKGGKNIGKVNPYFGKAKNSLLKSKKSYQKLLNSHKNKLCEYMDNPAKFDNKRLLKNAPTKAIKDKIIRGRIKVLGEQINKHKNEIMKINEVLKNKNQWK